MEILQSVVAAGSIVRTVRGLTSSVLENPLNAIPEDPGSSSISSPVEHEVLALSIRQWNAVTMFLLFQCKVHGRPRPNAV